MIEKIKMRDGEHLSVRIIGKGKPVMLLHGFGMESSHWLPFIIPFTYHYQFILPDFRGFGQSAFTPINNSCVFTNFYEDIEDIIDHYHFDQVILGGISMGAYVSLFYLSQKKHTKIQKFLCIDQSPSFKHTKTHKFGLGLDDHEQWMSDFKNVLTLLKKYQHEKDFSALPCDERYYAVLKFAKFASASFPSKISRFTIQTLMKLPYTQLLFLPKNWRAYYTILNAYIKNDYNLIEVVQNINVQTTIFVGMLSEMYPFESSMYLHQKIQNSKLVKFENSGHAVMMCEPVKFMIELYRFLIDDGLTGEL